jgi:hypothetical protein
MHTHARLLGLCVSSLALILSSAFCSADDCPANMQVTLTAEETLGNDYQPGDGTMLKRYRFRPPAPYQSPYPTVLLIPPAEFKGADDAGVTSERWASYDLQQAGFLVFQVEHRLAPPGYLDGQPHGSGQDQTDRPPESGRPPEQTDDIKRQILAAVDDTDCNQSIYLVGGSSGASHALWVALDSASGAVTRWDNNVRVKIKAVVGLSGIYDLGSRDYGGQTFQAGTYVDIIENYTNTHLMMQWYGTQEAASPMTLIANASSCPPVMLFVSDDDTVPSNQSTNMKTALLLQFPSVEIDEYTLLTQTPMLSSTGTRRIR